MPPLSDQALIDLYITTKDKRYFAQLYSRHRYRVYQICLCFCHDPQEAEDFTQDIFLRISIKIDTFSGAAQFTSWLSRVATNYCIDQLRERHKRQTLHQRYSEELEQRDPKAQENEEKALEIMQQVMQQLTAAERHLLQSKYADHFTIEHIAHQQKLTMSAVKMRIKRARDRARFLYNHLYTLTDQKS